LSVVWGWRTVTVWTAAALTAWSPGPAAAVDVGKVSIHDDHFDPHEITVDAGGEVVWTHNGERKHTVTADNGSFDSGTLRPRSTFQRTFNESGRYPYHCRFHGERGGKGMSGVVEVRFVVRPPPPDEPGPGPGPGPLLPPGLLDLPPGG
jgi:plastocyanin